jgi:hypothetical protein
MYSLPLTEKKLQEAGKAIYDDYVKKLADRSYSIANQIKFEVKINGDRYQVILELPEYWKNVEYGRGFGDDGKQPLTVKKMPPKSVILEWIDKKNIGISKISDESLAYLIARSISKNGIKPKFYLENSIKKYDYFIKEITEALKTDIINGILQTIG